MWRGDDGRYYCKKDNGTTGLLIGGAVGGFRGAGGLEFLGEDVQGLDILLVDDMLVTGDSLLRIARDLKSMQEDLERNGPTMADGDRRNKERALNELNRDFQRKQREFQEDLNGRRNEELQQVLDKANKAVKQVATDEKYDIVIQEVVYSSPRHDITEKVLKILNQSAK